jgi:hypothetical protein
VLRWLGYAGIFIVAVFVMDAVLVIVALLAGMASADALSLTAGPITLVIEFILAALITYLIVRPRPEPVRDLEAKRGAEEYLEELHRMEEQEDRHQHELERLRRLRDDLARWREARDLRAQANEALAVLGERDVTTAQGRSLRDELQWALEYADSIDPLHGGS